MKKRIAVLGASGYTGREVLRLARQNSEIEVDLIMSARADSTPPLPATSYDQQVSALDLDKLRFVDGVFVCAPHGVSQPLVRAAVDAGAKVVDLSADFRLRDAAAYERTYGVEHTQRELLATAVYGLTELHRAQIAHAKLIANPGCYPTAVSLPLVPLLRADLLELTPGIIADCKSGASGAGVTPSPRTHFGAVHENFCAYGVGTHRHTPEIWQNCGTEAIVFVPHLLPVFRGIFATIYVTPRAGIEAGTLLECLDSAYAGEPFVRIYTRGLPELNSVQFTNYCDIAVAPCGGGRIAILSVIDNLVKGAAGQAMQNMNLMLGLPEVAGLR